MLTVGYKYLKSASVNLSTLSWNEHRRLFIEMQKSKKMNQNNIDLIRTTVHKGGKSQSNDWFDPFQKMKDDLFSMLCERRPTRLFFSEEMLWLIEVIHLLSCLCFEDGFL